MGISREEALCIYVLAGLILLGSAVLLWNNRPARLSEGSSAPTSAEVRPGGDLRPEAEPLPETAEPLDIVVHVSGAVKAPGVYRLKKGDRVIDAVSAAGGPTPDAATEAVNLAARLEDGQKVHVPTKKDMLSGSTAGIGTGPGAAKKIGLNSATAEQLDSLPGIGPGLAAAIIEYR
ncbi:MAG: SLBB domain-containing protein, partial [Firmicutes bacterium]|nr:SLBB domain-containing protein [Bacillota bacterium]